MNVHAALCLGQSASFSRTTRLRFFLAANVIEATLFASTRNGLSAKYF